VSRHPVLVRDAVPGDVIGLTALWAELRDLARGLDRMLPVGDAEACLERLQAISEDPNSRAMVATVDGEVAGMVVLSVTSFAPLFDQRAVHAHYLHVRSGFRRRGVGKALLAAAVSFADETGAEHVIASVLPQLRDTQRFYARLGFGPLVVRRSVPVGVLRRRLGGPAAAQLADHLVARRRSLRRVRTALARTATD
jgi:GNAT superfamily N-acetyltransferase